MNNSIYNPKKTIVIAFVLFLFDAFIMNQGGIAVICLLSVFLFWLPKSIALKLNKQQPKEQLIKSLIFTIMAISVFGANTLNNRIAKNRAEQLILVIERYHQDTSHYPTTLEDLVPTYIPQIPNAKYTLPFKKYLYLHDIDNAFLLYFYTPFGTHRYNFKSQSWHYRDM